MPAKLTFEEVKAIPILRGGRLLSTSYDKAGMKLEWECAVGHTWWAQPSRIKTRNWCKLCARARIVSEQFLTIEDVRADAARCNGELLSTEYVNSKAPLRWRCLKGHEFQSSAIRVRQGSFCHTCDGKRRAVTIESIAELITSFGGRLLSTACNGAYSRIEVDCGKGHPRFMTTPRSVRFGIWCKVCGRKKAADKTLISNDVIKAAVFARGGSIVSEHVRGVVKPIWIQCAEGHKWKAPPRDVIRGTSWCGVCSGSRGEKMTRACIESLFKREFPTTRTPWLKTKRLGCGMSLDGYCPNLALAFEYDGNQHVRFVPGLKMDTDSLAAIIERDRLKDRLCVENGVTLVRIPQVDNLTETAVLKAVLKAIRANPAAMAICRAQGVRLSSKVSPGLRAAMFETGCDGTGQMVMPGIAAPVHMG